VDEQNIGNNVKLQLGNESAPVFSMRMGTTFIWIFHALWELSMNAMELI